MNRLVVNPDTDAAWEIQLEPGPHTLGSGQENSIPIAHPSVAAAHCQITAMSSGTIIKDLGSDGGTWVDGARVEEAVLLPGQTIRIGEVLMRYEREPQPAVGTAATVASAPSDGAVCKFHPKAIARFRCPKCSASFCELCVNIRSVDGQSRRFCRACAEECAALTPAIAPGGNNNRSFASQAPGAFVYPFQAGGWALLGGGTVFYLVLHFLAARAFILGAAVMLFGTGYLVAYLQHILVASATGEDRMPDWPEFTGYGSVLVPAFQFLGTVFVSLAPLTCLRIFASPDSSWLGWAMIGTIVFACMYFPIAFTGVAMFDSFAALNPLFVAASILKIPLEYSLAVVLLIARCAFGALGDWLLPRFIPIPILPKVILEFFSLYLFAVEMRLLGVLYRTKKDELGWFSR